MRRRTGAEKVGRIKWMQKDKVFSLIKKQLVSAGAE